MLHFLGILFIIIIAVLFIGLSFIGAILRGIFGGVRRKPAANDTVQPEEGELHINRKKIFTKDDGEYVDFEEVKE